MKRVILLAIAILAVSFSAFAASHDPQNPQNTNLQARMQAEKVAYLTTAMGLTPEEAQKFWPLYNKAQAESSKASGEVMKAFVELDQAIKDGKSTKEISALVNKYVKAEQESRSIDAKYAPQYMKILTPEKVAKLFIGEEEFRRLQMRRYSRGHDNNSNTNKK